MTEFTHSTPILACYADHWEVVSFEFRWRDREWIVPIGADTDFASIPRLATVLVGGRSSPDVVVAALAHDWLYWLGHDRRDADTMFRCALRANGVGVIRRWLMFVGVRIGGWVVHRKRRADAVLEGREDYGR